MYGLGVLFKSRSGEMDEFLLVRRKWLGTLPLIEGPNGLVFIGFTEEGSLATERVSIFVFGDDLTLPKLVPGGEMVPLHGWLNFSRRF